MASQGTWNFKTGILHTLIEELFQDIICILSHLNGGKGPDNAPWRHGTGAVVQWG